MKILGAIELWGAHFHYWQDTVFNATTYFAFWEQLALRYRRRMEVVRHQSKLAGGASTAPVLARVESCRAPLAAHTEEPDS